MNHLALLIGVYLAALLGTWTALSLRRALIQRRLLSLLTTCRCRHAESHHFQAIGCTSHGCLCPFFERSRRKVLADSATNTLQSNRRIAALVAVLALTGCASASRA